MARVSALERHSSRRLGWRDIRLGRARVIDKGTADGDDVRLHACAPVWVDASGAYPCGRFLCSEGQKPFREGIRVLKVRVESPLGRCGSAVGSVDDEIEEVGRRQGDRLVGGLVENK